jgi:hypothetical protein
MTVNDYEELGRSYLDNIFTGATITHSTYEFDTKDSIIEIDGVSSIVEVKTRNISSTDYQEDLLEYKKANALFLQFKELEENNVEVGTIYYVMIFNDNVAFKYDLLELKEEIDSTIRKGQPSEYVKFQKKKCNVFTVGSKDKILKRTILINKNFGERIAL